MVENTNSEGIRNALSQHVNGNTQEALNILEKCDQKNEEVVFTIASLFIQLGAYEEAAKRLQSFKYKFHGSFLLGKAQFYLGSYFEAEINLDRALELTQTLEEGEAHFANKIKLLRGKARLELKEEKKQLGEIQASAYGGMQSPIQALKSTGQSDSFKIDMNYDWYQNTTHAFVSYKVLRGSDPESKVKVEVGDKQIVLENSENGEILSQIDLAYAVDPNTSTTAFSLKRIEIKLQKVEAGQQWPSLEPAAGMQAKTQQIPVSASGLPAYPSSNKKKRDWTQIDKDIDSEMAKDKPEGEAAMNDLFKQIYERSDPETRRAMIKSYQTSGGTVLSTNWGEVTDKDYEGVDRPSAPDGQKWANEK